MALIIVLVLSLVGLALVSAVTSYAIGSQNISRHDQDWNAALAAAEAGVDDYLYRLNRDGNYWQYSVSNPPPDGNQAFSQEVPVPGPANEGLFTYEPDASSIGTDGTIKLTVTGRVRDADRELYVTLRRRNFLDYLYFTDYETKDPAAYVKPPDPFTPAEAQTKCAKHYYEGRDSQCIRIFFFGQDVINGPLHSNDAINMSGNPQFNGDTSTSWDDPAGKRWLGSGSPQFANPGDPKFLPPLSMPPTNAALKAEADQAVGGTGCLYTGPTQITLVSTGKMNVVSPFTQSTNVGCGPGPNLDLPVNGVVYVQNVPSTPGDPNYTAGCPYPPNNGYPYPPGLPVPISNDLTKYGCRSGDAFVSGTLKGQLSIGAENNVVIVDHTLYAGGTAGNDLLGLIANGYVQIFHPVDCTSATSGCLLNRKTGGVFTNATIQAANLSVQHSFIVPYYQAGTPLGNLNVTGVIAQRYRGPVGTFSPPATQISGYKKTYVYDTRLRYLSPPHFLDPVQSAWGGVTWAEI